jgi:membrane protein
MFAAFDIHLSWGELLKRTARDANEDDCLGLAAQLAYYFFFALFPALLFVLALASFLPLTQFVDQMVAALRPIAPGQVLEFLREQLERISNADSGGILTIGVLGAMWSSSAALVAIISSLNRAYDIEEARPWWKVRLTAIALTLSLAVLGVASFSLVVMGPTILGHVAPWLGLGPAFQWAWTILQWPVAFFLVSTAIGLIYHFAPDAEQEWEWVTPGAVAATVLWVLASLVFKLYVSHFTDYNAVYGTAGAVMVVLLWFYMSALAILLGAEMNAEIEHASPWGKEPGEKVPGQKKKIGAAAAREFRRRPRTEAPAVTPAPVQPAGRLDVAQEKNERTLGELFADLSRDTRTLIQDEVRLAKTELSEQASAMGRGAGVAVGGGLIAYGGLLAVIAAVVLALIAVGLPPWAGALLGGIVAAGAGYLLVRYGLATIRAINLAPRKTVETLKEDAQWLKEQTR